MAAIVWQPTSAALAAALATASGDDAAYGGAIQAKLDGLGAAYDAAFVGVAATTKELAVGAQAVALGAWTAAAQASHEQADKAARYAEELQLAAQSSAPSSNPLLFGGQILAPSTPIAWSYPETPIAQASYASSSWSATLPGTVDLGTINYATLAGQSLSVVVATRGFPPTLTVSFAGVTSPAAVSAAIEAAGNGALAPYLVGTKLVLATTPGTLPPQLSVSGAAAATLGLSTTPVDGTQSTLVLGARLSGALGNAMTATVGPASDGHLAHVKLTVAWGTYVEEFDNFDTLAPPDVSSSKLLASVFNLGSGHAIASSGAFSGGAGGANGAEVARLSVAQTYPAAIAAGQAAIVEAHQLRYASIFAEAPPAPTWQSAVPIPTAGVSSDVPLTADGRIDVFLLDAALAAQVALGAAWLASFGSPF